MTGPWAQARPGPQQALVFSILSEPACEGKLVKGWHPHGRDLCYLQGGWGARTPRLCLKGQRRGKRTVKPSCCKAVKL